MSDIKTKFMNDPEQITPELLEGYVLAYPDQVKLGGENIVVRANPKSEDKVAIVTLGGSGHEPALSGFVGEGMLDCSVVGDIFAAPGAQRLFQALQLMKREGVFELGGGNITVRLHQFLVAAVHLHTDFIHRKVDSLCFDALARSTVVLHDPQAWGNVHLATELFNLAVSRWTARLNSSVARWTFPHGCGT